MIPEEDGHSGIGGDGTAAGAGAAGGRLPAPSTHGSTPAMGAPLASMPPTSAQVIFRHGYCDRSPISRRGARGDVRTIRAVEREGHVGANQLRD